MNRAISPGVGDILLHTKGGYYRVITYCKHSETRENMIVYEALATKGVEVKPVTMFTTNIFTIAIKAEQLELSQ